MDIPTPSALLCPECHQPIQPTWYFCANCGKKLNEPPPATDLLSQLWLYAFSIILPFIAFIAVGKWRAPKYVRSSDPQAQSIGWIAIGLLALSTIALVWVSVIWFNSFMQQLNNSLNSGLGGLQ